MSLPSVPRQAVIRALLTIWVLFSLGYIAYDLWSDFQVTRVNAALQQGFAQGRAQAVNDLLTQAKSCTPIPITIDGQVVDQFVSLTCQQNTNVPASDAAKN